MFKVWLAFVFVLTVGWAKRVEFDYPVVPLCGDTITADGVLYRVYTNGAVERIIPITSTNMAERVRQFASPPLLLLASGQSNARGWQSSTRSLEALRKNLNDSLRSNWPALAVELNLLTGHEVSIANYYLNSTPLVSNDSLSWGRNGVLFNRAANLYDQAILTLPPVVKAGVVWAQGEADTDQIANGVVTEQEYEDELVFLIARFRGRYGAEFPFYIVRLGSPGDSLTAGWPEVRRAQERVAEADPYTYIVAYGAATFPHRGLMLNDGLHYTTAGHVELGREAARTIAPLVH